MYTYVTEGDSALTSFSLAHDLRYKIPLIQRAMATSGKRLKLFASPWSPPAFMKTNNDMLHGGRLRAEYADSWARYYTTFIEHYRKAACRSGASRFRTSRWRRRRGSPAFIRRRTSGIFSRTTSVRR